MFGYAWTDITVSTFWYSLCPQTNAEAAAAAPVSHLSYKWQSCINARYLEPGLSMNTVVSADKEVMQVLHHGLTIL